MKLTRTHSRYPSNHISDLFKSLVSLAQRVNKSAVRILAFEINSQLKLYNVVSINFEINMKNIRLENYLLLRVLHAIIYSSEFMFYSNFINITLVIFVKWYPDILQGLF